MELVGKKVIVVGLAKSGVAACHLLVDKGAQVVATDSKPPWELPEVPRLEEVGVQLALGGHPEKILAGASLVVLSPGVPSQIPFLQLARKEGIPIWSEVELAYRFCPAPIVAITGANGKTTTTAWLGEMLNRGGKRVIVAGNIGTPLSAVVHRATPGHWVVAEVSSFQLEGIKAFRPRLAALLNLTADHLDRHGSFAHYAAAKARIFANQTAKDFSILNADDDEVLKLQGGAPGKNLWFSTRHELEEGAFLKDGHLMIRTGGQGQKLCPSGDLALPGQHNLENGLAASLLAHLVGVSSEAIVEGLQCFPGVEHRCEQVAVISGVLFINDSKGTNPEAAVKALEAFSQPIILIAGGKAKGCDFARFAQVVKERVKQVVLLGEAAPIISEALAQVGFRRVVEVSSVEAAVEEAFSLSVPGDCILLSPACASWDMFSSFEERGRVFKEAVDRLGRGKG